MGGGSGPWHTAPRGSDARAQDRKALPPADPIVVEPGRDLMRGDNRDHSKDSRVWGARLATMQCYLRSRQRVSSMILADRPRGRRVRRSAAG
jgi:hypothetical protein